MRVITPPSSSKVNITWNYISTPLIPVAARSKTWISGRLRVEIVGSNPTRGIDFCLLMSVVLCQVEDSATG
jgi:hypothetical protein